ncbi:SCP2 sterol-binding domain-containing protein [Melampsora americana]|nr:SCP2 sterol-binding domain-containing protein [Melampsora americana]
MSDLKVEGVESSVIFETIAAGFEKMPEAEKKAQMKKVNGIFQLNVKGTSGKEGQWTIDFKKEGKVYLGPAKPKADVIINMEDKVFKDLADGKMNGQKAFMSGQLKVKGNMMLATKLDVLLKGAKAKL